MKSRLKGLSFFLGLALVSGSLNAAAQMPPAQNQPAGFFSASAPAHSSGEALSQITLTPTPAPRSRLNGDVSVAGSAGATQVDQAAPDISTLACTNLLQDPGFEAGVPNPYWGETSTNFGTPLCTPGTCNGIHSNAAPRTGSVWGWFGGTPITETATLTQTVTFLPNTTTLDFYLWIGSAGGGSDANDKFNAYIDNTPVFTATALQAGSYLTYTLVSLNVAAYANGNPHVVSFAVTTTIQQVDFNLDDLVLCADSTSSNFKIYLPLTMENYTSFDLSVSRVEVIQGITMGDSYTVHIANRPAFFRAFLNLSGPTTLSDVTGRLTRYVGGVAQDSLNAGPITAQATTNEGNLSHTLNFNLPSNWLVPGTAYVFEIDPLNSLDETNEGNNRYPPSLQQSFDFVNADPLQVVIVPVTYARPGIIPTNPNTSNLSYLTWMPIKVYPVSTINYTLHASHITTQDLRTYTGWSNLLNEITNLHDLEEPGVQTKVYYGVVNFYSADGCSSGCITGIGWISSPTATGFSGWGTGTVDAGGTFTHEMGHNFNRQHAPCGNPGGPDGSYPYSGGGIGQWGYDVFAPAGLLSPTSYKDYMSYCSPEWTSDYTYKRIYDYRFDAAYNIASSAETIDAFYLSGSLDDQGQAHVSPLYRQTAPIPPEPTAGTHRVELLDANGKVLAIRSFNLTSIAFDTSSSGGEGQGFSVFMPAVTGVEAIRIYTGDRLLFERSATGPSPVFDTARRTSGASVEWTLRAGSPSVVYRIRFSPDGGATWQVLALEYAGTTYNVPAALLANATQPLVEIQAMDGVRTDTRLIALNGR